MQSGYLALVLNAHLPFVREPDYPHFLEERWLFEALSESYLPLLRMFRRLEADSIPFNLTLSLSPTLCSMLDDKVLGERYLAFLASQLELARSEEERVGNDPVFGPLARLYAELYESDRRDFDELYNRNILSGFDYYYKKGKIELITSTATHCFLPAYRESPEAISAQIEAALVSHRQAFGKHPAGIWLPHLGWYPGLEDAMRAYNLQYTVVTTRGALLGEPTPRFGSFAPVQCGNGVTAFIRDAAATEAVWSQNEGYPSDPLYREFYRDIGFDLPLDYMGPYIEGSNRTFTGFKYWAVTGHTEDKKPYDYEAARKRAAEHAASFLADRREEAAKAQTNMSRPPLMVCPYDAELFGHGWFEGQIWLESIFRDLAASEDSSLRLLTLGEYQKLYPDNQVSMPEFSSWGDGGYAEVLLDGSNDWIYRHIFKMIERITELAERFPNESGLRERILDQAAREVLLSMSSDWSLLMRAGKSSSFAKKRVEEAISNFGKIYEMLCSNTVSTEWITHLEKRNNLFPEINYRMFRKKR
jgi:1,4-alpha-glucan branching enzyme